MFDNPAGLEQMWDTANCLTYFHKRNWRQPNPLFCGNGLSLLDSMQKAIHTVVWLKRKLNPFDVINVSITAFADKMSMEIIEKSVIFRGKCLGMTYWILFEPEYEYIVWH